MGNIPRKYTQEAEDERGMRRKLKNPKSRWGWAMGRNVSQKDWDAIFGKKNKEV